MPHPTATLVFSALFITGTAAAAATPTPSAPPLRGVVELFTSQGCSSCPPADRILGELANAPDLIALTYPVDYWDYIGWKDTLAEPAFTARQKGYASMHGDGQVYTPQAVVDGVTHVIGSDRDELTGALASSARKDGAMTVPVTLSPGADGHIAVDVGAAAEGAPRKAAVWLVDTLPSKTVVIGRGENSGRSVTYTNVARKISRLGDWTGVPMHFDLMRRVNETGYVVLLQPDGKGPGPIFGAAKAP